METNVFLTILVGILNLFTLPVVFAFQVAGGEITTQRARALLAVAVGLISAAIGAVAFVRSGRGSGSVAAAIALVLGLIAAVLSVIHIAGSTGFGTGGGRAGAIVALVLALAGIVLAGVAFTRSRKRQGTEGSAGVVS